MQSRFENSIKLQSAVRGFLARRKYRINHLKNNQLTSYKTFVIGNDPLMPSELVNYIEPNDKIVLIATSGMRAVSLACMLGNHKHTPKIILIDNSRSARILCAMQEFMSDDTKTSQQDKIYK